MRHATDSSFVLLPPFASRRGAGWTARLPPDALAEPPERRMAMALWRTIGGSAPATQWRRISVLSAADGMRYGRTRFASRALTAPTRTLARIIHRGWAGLRGAARRSVVFGGIRDAGDRGLRLRRGGCAGASG